MNFESMIKLYNYQIPQDLIAQEPASPRDSARLLVYDRKRDKIFYDTFTNLAKYLPRCKSKNKACEFKKISSGADLINSKVRLKKSRQDLQRGLPKGAVLVFNETKVIPARLVVKKETGGKARMLYIASSKNLIKVMADRKIAIGAKLALDKKIFFTAEEQDGKYYYFRPSFSLKNLYGVLEKYGEAPLPPYIKHSPLGREELKEKYQAIFARQKGSVAAPTASLHFTRRLIEKIKKAGFDIRFVTLHVNLGTFAPLEEKHIKEGKLHEEYYEIDKKTAVFLNKAKKEGRPIIAVGTTVVRTLESAASAGSPRRSRLHGDLNKPPIRQPADSDAWLASHNDFSLKKLSGKTGLFIREGYGFKFTDAIITNFHVPRSSLLMLVAALVGRRKLLSLYKKAIHKKFKFFSFGDGMLIK